MHFIVGHWLGELLLLVWNNWAPFGVPLFQRVSEVSIVSGASGGHGTASCCGCSQLHNRAPCAAIDLAVAHQYLFLAALTE